MNAKFIVISVAYILLFHLSRNTGQVIKLPPVLVKRINHVMHQLCKMI